MMRIIGIGSGLLAFTCCLAGGLWILTKVGFDYDDNALSTAIGLYFIGKAFFVGPLLILTALKS